MLPPFQCPSLRPLIMAHSNHNLHITDCILYRYNSRWIHLIPHKKGRIASLHVTVTNDNKTIQQTGPYFVLLLRHMLCGQILLLFFRSLIRPSIFSFIVFLIMAHDLYYSLLHMDIIIILMESLRTNAPLFTLPICACTIITCPTPSYTLLYFLIIIEKQQIPVLCFHLLYSIILLLCYMLPALQALGTRLHEWSCTQLYLAQHHIRPCSN